MALLLAFQGGAADKTGILRVGDEIVSVNGTACGDMSRIEAWNFMKKLPNGEATLVLKQEIRTDINQVEMQAE